MSASISLHGSKLRSRLLEPLPCNASTRPQGLNAKIIAKQIAFNIAHLCQSLYINPWCMAGKACSLSFSILPGLHMPFGISSGFPDYGFPAYFHKIQHQPPPLPILLLVCVFTIWAISPLYWDLCTYSTSILKCVISDIVCWHGGQCTRSLFWLCWTFGVFSSESGELRVHWRWPCLWSH